MLFELQQGQLGRSVIDSGVSGPSYTFANVSLLLHGSSRPFIDVSSNKYAVCNRYGSCGVSGGKITFAGTGSDLRVMAPAAAWQFGTGSWFVSAKVSSSGSYATAVIPMSCYYAASSAGWQIVIDTSSRPCIDIENTRYGAGTPAANLLMAGSGTESTVSFSYDGTDLRCFVDGALSWTQTVALNIDTSHRYLWIGNQGNSGGGATSASNQGVAATAATLRELLVVKGESVATAAFTVPASWTDTGITLETWNPTTYSNVKLNVHMSGTNGGTTFTDTSTSARTVTPHGNAQTSTAQARIGSSSGLFDGTGDYLTVPDSADWDFGTGDYAVEVQIRPAVTTRVCGVGNYDGASNGWYFDINLTTVGRFRIHIAGDTAYIDSADAPSTYVPITQNAWQHFAWGRKTIDSISFGLGFYEGECIFMLPDSTNITGSTTGVYVGRLTTFSTAIDFNGYMQELRVVKGEGFPRSFLVPTSALPDS